MTRGLALLISFMTTWTASCASETAAGLLPADDKGGLPAVDVVDPHTGRAGTMAFAVGKVTFVDVCVAWSDACLINAQALSEACKVVCREGTEVVSILLDEQGAAAADSYQDVIGVAHKVLLPGPRVRAGDTVLGDVTGVPILYVFDADGDLDERVDGAVVNAPGLIERARDMM